MPPDKAKKKPPTRKQNLTKRQIVAAHRVVAKFFKDQSLEVSEEDAAELADALHEFAKEFGLALSGKSAATMNLLLVFFMIETPVVLRILAGRKKPADNEVKGALTFEPVIPA